MQIPEQRRATHPVRQIRDIGWGWEDAIRTLWTGNITPRRTNVGIEIVVPVLIKLVVQQLVMEPEWGRLRSKVAWLKAMDIRDVRLCFLCCKARHMAYNRSNLDDLSRVFACGGPASHALRPPLPTAGLPV